MNAIHRIALAVTIVLALASQGAGACSVAGSVNSPQQLVTGADGIYRVRADGYLDPSPTKRGETGQIRFVVLETLKGALAETLTADGVLAESDDRNDLRLCAPGWASR